MATTTPQSSARGFDRVAQDQKIRHPLASIRSFIRVYVILEGLALTLLFLGLWFWLGLGVDLGLYQWPMNFDWVKVLDLSAGVGVAFYFRAALLLFILLILIGVVVYTIFRRLFFDFSDTSVIMVLERRYSKQLGDRLITALELADPALAKKYGYSQAMVDETIKEAANRVDALSVPGVFNWGRLILTWLLALFVTVGIYLITLGVLFAVSMSSESGVSPMQQLHRNGWVWTNRNVLLSTRYYWPTQSYVEVVRFQDDPEHPGETVVAKNESGGRSDFRAKAFEWVIFDPTTKMGIRPLMYADLKNYIPEKELAKFTLPNDWPDWIADLDDLDSSIPLAMVPPTWDQQKLGYVKTEYYRKDKLGPAYLVANALASQSVSASGGFPAMEMQMLVASKVSESDDFILQNRDVKELRDALDRSELTKEFLSMMDWHQWTVDKILFQQQKITRTQNEKIKALLREQKTMETFKGKVAQKDTKGVLEELEILYPNDSRVESAKKNPEVLKDFLTKFLAEVNVKFKEHETEIQQAKNMIDDLAPFDKLRTKLEELAQNPATSWNIRHLVVPATVRVNYWGKKTSSDNSFELRDGKYYIGLNDLKEDVDFRVYGNDYYTPTLKIKLWLPPSFSNLTFKERHPTYRYYTVNNGEEKDYSQEYLKGKKQDWKTVLNPPSGFSSELTVPNGTELVIVATVERPLKKGGVLIKELEVAEKLVDTSVTPDTEVEFFKDDNTKFKLNLGKVNRTLEFKVLFVDKYNIEGRHQFTIKTTKDEAPVERGTIDVASTLYKLSEFSSAFIDPKSGKPPEFRTRDGDPLKGYLITANAQLRFDGLLNDDIGLNKMEWDAEYEFLDFELDFTTNTSAAPPKETDTKKKPRKTFPLRLPMAFFENRLEKIFKNGGTVPVKTKEQQERFAKVLDEYRLKQSDEAETEVDQGNSLKIAANLLDDVLKKTRKMDAENAGDKKNEIVPIQLLPKSHDISKELGFDLSDGLKIKQEGKTQLHFRLTLKVAATDNNVNTGPSKTISKAFTFLVVTDNELYALMLKKQDMLRDDLEAVKATLDDLVVVIDQMNPLILSNDTDPETLEVLAKKQILNQVTPAYGKTRDVARELKRMINQMITNRLESDMTERLERNVYQPLQIFLRESENEASRGQFANLNEKAKSFWKTFEQDATLLKVAKQIGQPTDQIMANFNDRRLDLAFNATQLKVETQRTAQELQRIINAISGQLKEKEVIDLLVKLERNQRHNVIQLQQILDDTLEGFFKDLSTPKTPKKDDKKK